MTDKDRERITNYAIDNKVSLEEAQKHFIVKGREEKEKKFEKEYLSQEAVDNGHYAADGHLTEEEERFLKELHEKLNLEDPERYTDLYGDQPNSSPGEAEWWAAYNAKKKNISDLESDLERLYNEYSAEITKEEMDWVDQQLKEVDELIKAGQL